MKRIAGRSYICPTCGDSVKVSRVGVYVRCSCGTLAAYGNPENPVIVSAITVEIESTPCIISVPDDYKPTSTNGGIIYANPKRGKLSGLSSSQMDMIMPLLAFARVVGWDSNKLLSALQALKDYDKMIANDLR